MIQDSVSGEGPEPGRRTPLHKQSVVVYKQQGHVPEANMPGATALGMHVDVGENQVGAGASALYLGESQCPWKEMHEEIDCRDLESTKCRMPLLKLELKEQVDAGASALHLKEPQCPWKEAQEEVDCRDLECEYCEVPLLRLMEMISKEVRYILFLANSVSWQDIAVPRWRLCAMVRCILGAEMGVSGPVDTCPLRMGTDLHQVGCMWEEDLRALEVLKKCTDMFNERCPEQTSCSWCRTGRMQWSGASAPAEMRVPAGATVLGASAPMMIPRQNMSKTAKRKARKARTTAKWLAQEGRE